MEKHVTTLDELAQEATSFIQSLKRQDTRATLVTLSGELGAGKTAFTKAVAQILGIEEVVTSPTFVLEKIYALPKNTQGFARLIHIDAYRLKNGMELGALGFDELMTDPENLVLLEWPEMVEDALSEPSVRITLKLNEDGSRSITYG
jgi:tRNA threonylcarbamoyladenosine biosynthesis protein TsaE